MANEVVIHVKATGADVASREIAGLGSAAQGAKGPLNVLSETIQRIAMVGMAAGAAMAGLGAAIGLKFAADLEQAHIGFTTMLGSAAKADAFLRDMGEFAAKTPFEFPELLDASRTLMAFGFEAEDILPIMTDIGDAMAAMGRGGVAVERITYALGQMSTSGRVGAQDMMQLTVAGVEAWRYLAEASGKSIAEVRKLAEEGMLDARAAIQIILAGMRADYAGAMEAQSKTFSGLMSTMKDTARMGLANIMQPMLVALRDAMSATIDFTETATFQEWKENATSAVSAVASTMRDLATAIKGLSPEHISLVTQALIVLGGTAVTIKAVSVAVWGLSAAIAVLTAPVTLAALAAGATALALWRYPQLPEEFYDPRLMAQGAEATLRMYDEQDEAMRKLGEARRGVGKEMDENARKAEYGAKRIQEELRKTTAPLITTGKEAKTAADKLREAGFSVRDMASALAASSPLLQALGLRIVGMKDQLAGVNAAIEANAAAQRAMQENIAATRERIARLNDALSQAKQRLSDLTAPRLTGMGKLDEQIFQAEQAIKRFQLIAAGGRMPAGITMPKGTLTEWQRTLERLRLLREVTYEPMLRQLQAVAFPPAPEVAFGAALAGIRATQAEIANLEARLVSETETLRAQADALRDLQREQDALRESAAGLQAQIAQAEEQYKRLNDKLIEAIIWMLQGSEQAKKYGGVIANQAGVVDESAKKLLSIFFDFSTRHTTTTIADILAVVAEWEAAKNRIDELAGEIALRKAGILPEGIRLGVWRGQHGGIVTRPTLALLGEAGPEAVVPLRGGGGGFAGAGHLIIEVPVYLDREVIARAVWDSLKHKRAAGTNLGLA